MTPAQFIRRMPKVELHVHLEGSIRPETLLTLSRRNGVALPARTMEGLSDWYRFRDFAHFVEIYLAICNCLRTPDDFELVAEEFLAHQAEQNIRYSEVTFTPFTHRQHVSFDDQLAAINRARTKAEASLGIRMGLVPDISRHMRPVEDSLLVAEWAARNKGNGVIALGLGGPEIGNPPELFWESFDLARAAGLPGLPHAGETEGPRSIWGAIDKLAAARIGHGVRCLEDPELVAVLRERQIPLEVCPSSNVCLGVVPTLAEHPLPKLMEEGLFVTLGSDDPPMFGTTLTDEYLRVAEVLGLDLGQIQRLVLNGVEASLLPAEEKCALGQEVRVQLAKLSSEGGA